MARPVRTSNLLKEAAADHENLDRTAEQERLPVNRVAMNIDLWCGCDRLLVCSFICRSRL